VWIYWFAHWCLFSVRMDICAVINIMEVLFRYLVFDDFGEPIRRFRTKHEAEFYVQDKPNHIIRKLAPLPSENPFNLIKDEPLF
jgi:hypothetical protein